MGMRRVLENCSVSLSAHDCSNARLPVAGGAQFARCAMRRLIVGRRQAHPAFCDVCVPALLVALVVGPRAGIFTACVSDATRSRGRPFLSVRTPPTGAGNQGKHHMLSSECVAPCSFGSHQVCCGIGVLRNRGCHHEVVAAQPEVSYRTSALLSCWRSPCRPIL